MKKYSYLIFALLLIATGWGYGAHLVVHPREVTMEPGTAVQFEAQIFNDQLQPVRNGRIEWRVLPPGLGRITEDGFFMAGSEPGRGEVIAAARYGGELLTGKAGVTIGKPQDPPVKVVVRPRKAIVPPGERQEFKVIATGPGGVSLRTRNVRWMVEPQMLGNIRADGLFKAGPRIGQGRVIALVEIENQVYHGSADVLVSPHPNSGISGAVQDEAGAPIAEAVISATRIGLPPFTMRGKTGENGAYLLGKLIPGKYVVKAEKRGYLPQYYDSADDMLSATPIEIAENDTVPGIDFTLGKGGSISGAVAASEDGQSLAGVHVAAYHVVNPKIRVNGLTEDDGTYKLEGLRTGSYIVHANKEGFLGEYYLNASRPDGATEVRINGPEEKNGIDFTLDATSALKGVVTAENNDTPIAGAMVAVYTLVSDRGRNNMLHRARTNEQGEYTIQLRPGFYLVYADAEDYAGEWFENKTNPLEAEPVQIFAEQHTEINFDLQKLAGIAGKVTDETTDVAITGARVRAFSETRLPKRSFDAVTGEDGTYSLRGLPAGEYIVVANAADYLPEFWQGADSVRNATKLTVKLGDQINRIDFSLVKGGGLAGVVTDAESSTPLAGTAVSVYMLNRKFRKTTRSDENGRWGITGLPAGDYIVSAAAKGYAPQWFDGKDSREEAEPVIVPPTVTIGSIDFSLSLREVVGGTVAGVVMDDSTGLPIQDAQVVAMPSMTFGALRRALSEADGSYKITGLRPGIYVIVCHARGYIGEYYDNTPSWIRAKPMRLGENEDVSGIDFDLIPQQAGAYTLAGQVNTSDGNPVSGAFMAVQVEGEVIATAISDEDGAYIMDQLPADTYEMTVSVAGYEEVMYTATVGSGLSIYDANIMVTSAGTSVAEDQTVPTEFALQQNYPNPFNPTTEIKFSLGKPSGIDLRIFNLLGEEVKTLFTGHFPAGQYTASWDGTNNRGVKLVSGVYFYRLDAVAGNERFIQTHRMLMLK